MPQSTSQKKQLQFLIVLLVLFAIMLAYTFRDSIDIPTQAEIKRLRTQLADRKELLQRTTEEANAYQQSILSSQMEFESLKRVAHLDQEAQAKIDRILDDANITRTKNSVNVLQNKNRSNLEQVNFTMEFEDITMRKLCDFFETFAIRSNDSTPPMFITRVTVNSRTIGRRTMPGRRMPEQPPVPGQPPMRGAQPVPGMDANPGNEQKRQLNATIVVSAFSLYPNASDLLFAAPKANPVADDANGTKLPAAKNTATKNTARTSVKGAAK